MPSKLRKSPPLCLVISLARLLTGNLRYSKKHLGTSVKMEDGQVFTIFRDISAYPLEENETAAVFIVRFKFAALSQNANQFISKIPMLLITGFPGFETKMYAVNPENGYWQGMYQWESKEALEEYKKSFVLKMMNKRALKGTVSSLEFENQRLMEFIGKMKFKKQPS